MKAIKYENSLESSFEMMKKKSKEIESNKILAIFIAETLLMLSLHKNKIVLHISLWEIFPKEDQKNFIHYAEYALKNPEIDISKLHLKIISEYDSDRLFILREAHRIALKYLKERLILSEKLIKEAKKEAPPGSKDSIIKAIKLASKIFGAFLFLNEDMNKNTSLHVNKDKDIYKTLH